MRWSRTSVHCLTPRFQDRLGNTVTPDLASEPSEFRIDFRSQLHSEHRSLTITCSSCCLCHTKTSIWLADPRTCKLPDLLLPDHHLNRPALWTTGTSSICSLSLDSPKVHTPCPTDSCPQCLVGDKEARVLVILLGVTLIICAALLVSTVVLATQLCQQQQWRPNPRPLRSNTSFIRAQEERANGSPDRVRTNKKLPCLPADPTEKLPVCTFL
ncbi:ecdysone-induced protein 75B, isoforms C/D-like isoform X2 [Arapaima gigas]